jgi:hypothetical protein
MDRRDVLRILAGGGIFLGSVVRKASGQEIAALSDYGTGSLDPVGPSVDLPASVSSIVAPANDVLSLEVLNRDFNPLLSEPRTTDGLAIVGPFQSAEELFQGKALIPLRQIMSEAVQSMPLPSEAIQPLLDALSEFVLIRTPAHQFRLGQTLGNRIVFYGKRVCDDMTIDIAYSHIDRLTTELAKQNFRLIKQMMHFDMSQGGDIAEIVSVGDPQRGIAGSTHAGGFSAGFDENGLPMTIKSDWPANYGEWLGDGHPNYNAHIIAIDYSAGTKDPIPEEALKAYYRNADMWDCGAGMIVPFVKEGELDPHFQEYTYNPLEVYDQKSAREIASALATLDQRRFIEDHGTFYCAEGQYVIANLGPQEDESGGTLLKKSRYGDTRFGQLIASFREAPGYAGMSAEERQRHPYIGWQHLRRLGPDDGGISDEHYYALQRTDRLGIALDWIPEDIRGWQAYRPKDKEGLIARPMTVATIVWGLLRLYMPRDRVIKAIKADIMQAYASGDERIKTAVTLLSGGLDPESPSGQAQLAVMSTGVAIGLLVSRLRSDEVKTKLLKAGGFLEITNEADKQKVLAAYDRFLDIIQDADYSTQEAFDRALAEADAELANLTVARSFYVPALKRRITKKSSVMKYAPPAAFAMWAQQPFLAGTGCLRYVATAMHVNQASKLAL